MSDLTLPLDQVSPFDAIRHTRADGSEFWTSRDLMPLLGYEKFERFSEAIERAAFTIRNTGDDPSRHASRHWEPSGKTERLNHVLTRYGAYIVAMNCDPRKPEVASAQAYFAIKTREAETAVTAPALPTDYATALRALATEVEARENAEARRLELEGPAAERELYRAAEGKQLVGDVANRFVAYAKDRFPGVKVTHEMVRDHAGRLDIIIRGNTVRNNQPTSRGIREGWAVPSEHVHKTNTRGPQRKVTARLTVRGESRLWDGLINYVVAHGDLTIRKEISA